MEVSLGYPAIAVSGATMTLDEFEYNGSVDGTSITFQIPSDHWNRSSDPLWNWRAIQGRHYASLEVQTTGPVLEKEWSFIMEFAPPALELETYDYHHKFSFGLPTGWSLEENLTLNGSSTRLPSPRTSRFTCPPWVSFPLGKRMMSRTTKGLWESSLTTWWMIWPRMARTCNRWGDQFLQIDNRSAALFTLGIDGNNVMMRVGIIVSEAHDQYWIVMMSDTVGHYNDLLPTYDAIIMSMDIEQEEEPLTDVTDIMPYILVGVIAAVVAGLAIFLVLMRRR